MKTRSRLPKGATCCRMQQRAIVGTPVPDVPVRDEERALFIPLSMRVGDSRAERYFSSGSGSMDGTMNEDKERRAAPKVKARCVAIRQCT